MSRTVVNAATGIAKRTSRRGFLGRTGQLLLGVVGGSTLLTLMSGTAHATIQGCPGWGDCCFHWYTCDCSSPYAGHWRRKHYDCPTCNRVECQFTVCTQTFC
jgi:hypothetical protein